MGRRAPPDYGQSGLPPAQVFACLLFDDEDTVLAAEIIDAPRKLEAMQQAAFMMRRMPGAVGFQLWQQGEKVTEHFPARPDGGNGFPGGAPLIPLGRFPPKTSG